jgi:hypothetical protein
MGNSDRSIAAATMRIKRRFLSDGAGAMALPQVIGPHHIGSRHHFPLHLFL